MSLDREIQVGLWLNIDREQVRQSVTTTIGIGAAFGGVDENYFAQFTDSPTAAKLAAHNIQKTFANMRHSDG